MLKIFPPELQRGATPDADFENPQWFGAERAENRLIDRKIMGPFMAAGEGRPQSCRAHLKRLPGRARPFDNRATGPAARIQGRAQLHRSKFAMLASVAVDAVHWVPWIPEAKASPEVSQVDEGSAWNVISGEPAQCQEQLLQETH